MLQDPGGRVVLRRNKEETEIKLDPPENLYVHSIRHFNQAVLTGSQVLETRPNLLRCRRSMFPPWPARETSETSRNVDLPGCDPVILLNHDMLELRLSHPWSLSVGRSMAASGYRTC